MKHPHTLRLARTVCAAAVLSLAVSLSWAAAPFELKDIRIEGLQRTEPGTIFASLPFRVGDTFNDDKGALAIRSIFGLGLFKDVRLDVKGDTLVIIVQERPTIATVDFVGVKEFDKDNLRKALRDVGLADGRPFDQALADKAEQELKRQYISRSLYGASVLTTVTPSDRNRVKLTFTVTEGETAKIRDIRIIGNHDFSQGALRDQLESDTGGWLSWYTKNDRYSQSKLNADLESLRSFYMNRGYLDFKILSTQVAMTPDKQGINITINIDEGKRFVVSGIELDGNYLGKEDEFKTLITIKAGEAYKAEDVAATEKAFRDYFGTFGYALSQVDAKPEIDREKGLVHFSLDATPGQRVYVRNINVAGNTKTRDEVVRREFRQYESSWYNGDKINLSRDRVDRLGFFKTVGVDTDPVPGSPDQVDVNIAVEEKPTGNFNLGAGFSSSEKLSLMLGIRQENAFGSGNYVGIDFNTSKYNRQLALTTTNPYFTENGVSRTLDVYYRNNRPYDTYASTDYRLNTMGASIRFGVPFTEVDTVFFGAGAEQIKIEAGPSSSLPSSYQVYSDTFGAKSTSFPLTIGWSRDDRDSAIAPTTGSMQRVSADASLWGDARYARAEYQYQTFLPLNKQFTLAFNGQVGMGKEIGSRLYPVFKNFTAGGLGSVRGFEQGTLGPVDASGSYVGGSREVLSNLELQTPFPGAGNDRTLRLYGFYDMGNVFNAGDKLKLRQSIGFGLSWVSPVGPLRISYAKPLNPQSGDRIQRMQFQIGTAF